MLVCRLCELLPKLLLSGRVMLLRESCKARSLLNSSKTPTVKSGKVLQTSALGCWLSLTGAASHRVYVHVLFAADHITLGMVLCNCTNPFEGRAAVAGIHLGAGLQKQQANNAGSHPSLQVVAGCCCSAEHTIFKHCL